MVFLAWCSMGATCGAVGAREGRRVGGLHRNQASLIRALMKVSHPSGLQQVFSVAHTILCNLRTDDTDDFGMEGLPTGESSVPASWISLHGRTLLLRLGCQVDIPQHTLSVCYIYTYIVCSYRYANTYVRLYMRGPAEGLEESEIFDPNITNIPIRYIYIYTYLIDRYRHRHRYMPHIYTRYMYIYRYVTIYMYMCV